MMNHISLRRAKVKVGSATAQSGRWCSKGASHRWLWVLSVVLCGLASAPGQAPAASDGQKAGTKATKAAPGQPELRPAAGRGTPQKTTASSKAKAAKAPKPPDPNRLEWGLLPAINYDSDTGFGFGVIFSLAKFKPGFRPYGWRLETLIYMTVKEAIGGGLELPYHDDYVMIDMPGLAGGRLRLNAKLRFARFSNAGYYGLGNDAESDPALFQKRYAERYYQYDRIYPSGELAARIALFNQGGHKLELFVGARFTYNWIDAFREDGHTSKLKDDLASDDSFIKSQLVGTQAHGELLGNVGLIYDSRNHEFAPSSGMFHEISLRVGQGVGAGFTYGGVNMTTRFFFSLYKEYLVLALRAMGDVLFGHVPFYELARHGGLFPSEATGGGKSIRGILTQRFHGRGKLLGNIELRSKFLPFKIASERFSLGALAFFDVGRVWADLAPHPALDGTGAGVKMGVGGGLRLQWGETFLIRADVAWSPTDDNIGVYIDINHIF